MEEELLYKDITSKIIGAFYSVYNELGYGYKEIVYKKAMIIELKKFGLECKMEAPVKVYYDGQLISSFSADIIVNNLVIVELKAAALLITPYIAQLINYLKSTEIEVGLAMNFGPKAEYQRRVFTNQKKKERLISKKVLDTVKELRENQNKSA